MKPCMSTAFFAFVCTFFIKTLVIAVISLEAIDITPLRQKTQDQISLALHFDPLTIDSKDVNESDVCIVINGDICHCFETDLQSTKLTLTQSCLNLIADSCNTNHAPHCNYWFALHLTPPNTVVAHHQFTNTIPRTISTSPIHVSSEEIVSNRVTLTLPLTLDDLSRATVLLYTLRSIPIGIVYELLVFVPNAQHEVIEGALLGIARSLDLKFSIVVHPESILFAGGALAVKHVYPYAIQMAVKLLAARLVRTPFYITLDADVVLLRPFDLQQVIPQQQSKAIYHFEERTVHENWWDGSERLLGISSSSSYKYHLWLQREHCLSSDSGCGQPGARQATEQGFGVTPAIMSTYGSLLTVSYLCRQLTRHCTASVHSADSREECERLWLQGFGRQYSAVDPSGAQLSQPTIMLWSEYTLYRIVLDHFEVFNELHIREDDNVDISAKTILHCHNVWFESQLPWPAEKARDARNCLFSVIQSTTGINPSSVHKQYVTNFP